MKITQRGPGVWAAAAIITLTACSGPARPLSVGVQDVRTNVLLGNPDAPTPPPRPAAASLLPDFPLPVQPLPPPIPKPALVASAPEPPPPAEYCPDTNRDLPILHPAGQDIVKPPVDGTYPFRVDGSQTVTTGGRTVTTRYPVPSSRTVTRLPDTAIGNARYWHFKQTVAQGTTHVTTFFAIEYVNTVVSPVGDVPLPYRQEGDLRGVYLTGIDVTRVDGTIDSFRPQPSLLVMRLPAVAGDTGTSQGTDPLSQTSMTFTWRNAGRVVGTVPACGVPVGSFRVDLTEGRVVGNQSRVGANPKVIDFTASYYIATQYGGMIIGDRLESVGNDGTSTVALKTTSLINVIPKVP